MQKSFVIKIFTAQPLALSNYEEYTSTIFVKTNTKEFKSVLRSPHANKNAQEQFYKINYIYKIVLANPYQLKLFIQKVQHDQSANVKSLAIFEQQTILFKSF